MIVNIFLFLIVTQVGPALNIGNISLNGRGFIWEKAIDKEILNEILERWKKENSKLITAINGIGKGV